MKNECVITLWHPVVALPLVLHLVLGLVCLLSTQSAGQLIQTRSQWFMSLGAGSVEAGTLSLYHPASLSDSCS